MVSTALCISYFCFLPFWAQSRIAFPGPLSVGHYPSTSSGQRFEWNPLSLLGFPGGSVVKNMPVNAEVLDLITGSGRSPGEGNGNLLQYSCLGNFMDRGAGWTADHGITKESDSKDFSPHEDYSLLSPDGSRQCWLNCCLIQRDMFYTVEIKTLPWLGCAEQYKILS